jgi:hypothetical protein
MKKIIAAVAATALLSAAPAVAQASAAPVPAVEKASGSAQFEDMGPEMWLLGAVVLGLAIWGIVELVDDNDEDPVSP